MTRDKTPAVAALLFCSGMCALIYQTVWLREFRLIFGASTAATAAVLAIFMAGLGAGSAILGRRADARPRPLLFYAHLELLIAVTAALSVVLLKVAAKLYILSGGSPTLGATGATLVRLLLSTLILAAPTFLMGGTLPAAVRAVETSDDQGRRRLALLYGTNTLGAVTGVILSTFFALETFGNRNTLLIAAAINIAVALVARALSKTMADATVAEHEEPAVQDEEGPQLPPAVVLGAAAVVGFAFLLMELVWYRMLGPLLGGTTFMFGLILAIALLGIGLGGAAYSLRRDQSAATPGAFALTCTLEAAAMILPFALGDRLAVVANLLRPLGALGFGGHLLSWSVQTAFVVFPAAFISGIQFPMLIALLGRGRKDVGRHVGLAYTWNTAGAIAGSLAGGFGLLPILTAPGCWRAVALLLAGTGLIAVIYSMRARQRVLSIVAAAACLLTVLGTFAIGPTAAWRHSGVGAGRSMPPTDLSTVRAWIYDYRRMLSWEAEGRESSVALMENDDLAFIVNGKSDGSATGDAATQVMGGLIGAAVHPNPRTSLVIGLGTGSTAGWLGAVPSMERVDVVELEPVVEHVARRCATVNHDVLSNPKVKLSIADAREVLLTTSNRYDIIFSEPSNPYRAGIASLFTREFYEAASARMQPGGIFLQWVQAYDIDARTMQTIYATLSSVFPHVETWRAAPGDFVLMAAAEPVVYDMARIRARMAAEPYRTAMHVSWGVQGGEGFLSHFVGTNEFTKAVAARAPALNTDDRTPIEFGFGRSLGTRSTDFSKDELLRSAQKMNAWRPNVRGDVDWRLAFMTRAADPLTNVAPPAPFDSPEYAQRHELGTIYRAARMNVALALWQRYGLTPVNAVEAAALAESLADAGNEAALVHAEQLRPMQPVDADAIVALLRARQNRNEEAVAALEAAFLGHRKHPWVTAPVLHRALELARTLATKDGKLASRLYRALEQPFAASQSSDERRQSLVTIAGTYGCGRETLSALADIEPNVPWNEPYLALRVRCYTEAGLTDLAEEARRDWKDFKAKQPVPLIPAR